MGCGWSAWVCGYHSVRGGGPTPVCFLISPSLNRLASLPKAPGANRSFQVAPLPKPVGVGPLAGQGQHPLCSVDPGPKPCWLGWAGTSQPGWEDADVVQVSGCPELCWLELGAADRTRDRGWPGWERGREMQGETPRGRA